MTEVYTSFLNKTPGVIGPSHCNQLAVGSVMSAVIIKKTVHFCMGPLSQEFVNKIKSELIK